MKIPNEPVAVRFKKFVFLISFAAKDERPLNFIREGRKTRTAVEIPEFKDG